MEAGGVDAEQLEHFSLPVRVEEDEAVDEGDEEVEDDKDYEVVVDQLQHRTPIRHNYLHTLFFQENNTPSLSFLLNISIQITSNGS